MKITQVLKAAALASVMGFGAVGAAQAVTLNTMNGSEPGSIDPAQGLRRLGKPDPRRLHRRPRGRRRPGRRHSRPGRVLGHLGGWPRLHLPSARRHQVERRRAGDGRATSSTPSAACSIPRRLPTTPTSSTRSRAAPRSRDGSMPVDSADFGVKAIDDKTARNHARRPDPVLPPGADPLHRLSGARSTSSRPRAMTGPTSRTSSPTVPTRSSSGCPATTSSRSRTRTTRTPPTSRSTRSTTTSRTISRPPSRATAPASTTS